MRLPIDPSLPVIPPTAGDYEKTLSFRLTGLFRKIIQQLNGISEGSITACGNAATSAPTTGAWQQGDFIRNSAPTELGTAGSKYVIHGWICTTAGTPGTWKQARYLTGN